MHQFLSLWCITEPHHHLEIKLLKDPDFINVFKKEWTRYLEKNDLPGGVLLEAGKAVMWSKIISFSSHKKKKENLKVSELEIKIESLEHAYGASPDVHILNRIRKA